MRIFGPRIYHVDHTTQVPVGKQKGSRSKPFGSLIQLAVTVRRGTVKVCLRDKPGKPVIDFTVPGSEKSKEPQK
jgi:hypothetical protein